MADKKRSTNTSPRKGRGDPALGLRIRRLRTKLGLSQEALAHRAGRSENWVYLVEKGDAEPGYFDLLRLAEALGVEVATLLADEERSETPPRSTDASQMAQSRLSPDSDPAMMEVDSWPVGPDPGEWLEEMRRRAFVRAVATLTGATAAGWWPAADLASADAAVTTLRAALIGHTNDVREAPNIETLRDAVASLWVARQESRYSQVMADAPILLRQAQLAVSLLVGNERLAAHALLAAIYQAITGVLRKIGDLHLAAIAADRAMGAARDHGSAVTWADSVRFFSLVLGDAGHHDQAVQVCVSAADRLKTEELGHAQPSELSTYGQLLLTGAGAAAKGGDRVLADDFFSGAQGIAQRLGADANHRFTAFGPTNIDVHRVHAAVVLGDGEAALRRARGLNLDRLPVVERRAHHLLDVALGYNLIDKPEEATVSLLSAEQVAPEEIRYDPRARLLVEQLRHRGRTVSTQLDSLASRMQPLPS